MIVQGTSNNQPKTFHQTADHTFLGATGGSVLMVCAQRNKKHAKAGAAFGFYVEPVGGCTRTVDLFEGAPELLTSSGILADPIDRDSE